MSRSGETITSDVDEAVGNLPEDGSESNDIRATREVGMALGRLFNPALEGDTTANREAAVTSLVEHTGMSQAEADRREGGGESISGAAPQYEEDD